MSVIHTLFEDPPIWTREIHIHAQYFGAKRREHIPGTPVTIFFLEMQSQIRLTFTA